LPRGVYAQDQMSLDFKTKRVVYVHCAQINLFTRSGTKSFLRNTLGGRVTLIGDASNHCLPFLGQGKPFAGV